MRLPPAGSTGVTEAVPFDFTADSQRVVVADWTQNPGRIVIIRTADGTREQTLDNVGRVMSLAALDKRPPSPPLRWSPTAARRVLGTGATLASLRDPATTSSPSTSTRGGSTPTLYPRAAAPTTRVTSNRASSHSTAGSRGCATAKRSSAAARGDARLARRRDLRMSGGNPDVGWTVLRTDDGYDLTRFDGKNGALGANEQVCRRTPGRGARRVGGRPAGHVHAFQRDRGVEPRHRPGAHHRDRRG